MTNAAMKLPKNRQSRLAEDVWIAGEAIARHFRMTSAKDGFDTAIRNFALQLAERDPKFSAVWDQVREEGIEED